jgi:uncharacterized C2H2 Zn-finger protein
MLPGERLREEIRTANELARILADYSMWLGWAGTPNTDQQEHIEQAHRFIDERCMTILPELHKEGVAWCDLCGRMFNHRETYRREPLTGEAQLWCPDCLNRETAVFGTLGAQAYKKRWLTIQEAGW